MRTHRAVPVVVVILVAFVSLSGAPSAEQTGVAPPASMGNGEEVAQYREMPVTGTAATKKPPDQTKAPEAVVSTPATPTTTRSDPTTPTTKPPTDDKAAAIAVMAEMLNGPAFQRALDEPQSGDLGPSDAYELSQALWQSNSTMWFDLVDRFRLKGKPLAFRLLVYNEAFEDEDTTWCPELNGGKKAVKSSSPLPFYCAADGANGVLYWPVKTIETEWGLADGVPSSVVTRGLNIMFGQLFGEYIAMLTFNTYNGMKGAEAVPRPMQPATQALGYCFAGTALQGRYFDREAALNGLAFAYPAHDANQALFARALAFGFDTNDLGECMVQFWPRG